MNDDAMQAYDQAAVDRQLYDEEEDTTHLGTFVDAVASCLEEIKN